MGAGADGGGDDGETALLIPKEETDTPERTEKCSEAFHNLLPVCLGAIFYLGILWARNTLTFPFLCTTIQCAVPTPEGFDR